jgi:hypothetical protein
MMLTCRPFEGKVAKQENPFVNDLTMRGSESWRMVNSPKGRTVQDSLRGGHEQP